MKYKENLSISYNKYRNLKLEKDGEENDIEIPLEDDKEFYQIPEEKPESDALMEQYSEMQDKLADIKPETEEYNNYVQTMNSLMDQLLEINPNLAVRGEAQRLRRIAEPIKSSLDYSNLKSISTSMNESNKRGKIYERSKMKREKISEADDYDYSDESYSNDSYDEYADGGADYSEDEENLYYADAGADHGEDYEKDPMMSYEQYAKIRDEAESRDISDGSNMFAQNDQEDPEDAQARKDLDEVAGVYGLQLAGEKDPKTGAVNLIITKKGLRNFKQKFPDYVSAMEWVKKNEANIARSRF